jgi:GT2 family glycosyltransferase
MTKPEPPPLLAISAVVATAGRCASLARTLDSLADQLLHPRDIIIVDASSDWDTRKLTETGIKGVHSQIQWIPAAVAGAAAQRNQGVRQATQPFIWFFDDDVLFEPGCTEGLWKAINADPKLGGVNAMIVNQRYHPPGRISRAIFRLMHGRREGSYAGKVIGPVVTLLPEDSAALPDVVPVEWLNTTCTIYRREALPSPPFDAVFTGYSLMEDVALSLRVGKKWKLANARKARIVHDSQSGEHKSDARVVARMELINRYYVMRNVLDQRGALSILRLFIWQLFQLGSVAARSSTRSKTASILLGQAEALKAIIFKDKQ